MPASKQSETAKLTPRVLLKVMGILNLSLRPDLPPGLQPERHSSTFDSHVLLSTGEAQVEVTLISICFINVEDPPHTFGLVPDSLTDDGASRLCRQFTKFNRRRDYRITIEILYSSFATYGQSPVARLTTPPCTVIGTRFRS